MHFIWWKIRDLFENILLELEITEKSRKPAISTAHPGQTFEPGTSMTRSRSVARYSQ